MFTRNRTSKNQKGGGVAVYVKEILRCKLNEKHTFSNDDLECLCVDVSDRNLKITKYKAVCWMRRRND